MGNLSSLRTWDCQGANTIFLEDTDVVLNCYSEYFLYQGEAAWGQNQSAENTCAQGIAENQMM